MTSAAALPLRARRSSGRAGFSFRSLSTLFHILEIALNAEPRGAAVRLWTRRPGGPVV